MSDQDSDVRSPDDFEGDQFDDDDDDVDAVDDMAGNRVTGALPRAVLDYVARQIVDDPEAVVVELEEGRRGVVLRLHVAPDDVGKVIGRGGRIVRALRTVVRASAVREGRRVLVEIAD